ncbi:MAG: hypothetical protein B6245_15155 [Desulfobacteraceae bacterium 4572_88]|nr:MAG: hypothetical protein B6245_15155 [Desulfobacteraceae bacterium 4572_88]
MEHIKAGKTDSLQSDAMKIALVCKKFFIERGGLERYTVRLGRALLGEGHEVHVFANAWQEEPEVVFHHVPILRMSSPVKNLSFAYFCKRRLSTAEFDVVQSMERIFCQDIYRVSDGINPVHLLQRYPNPLVRKFKTLGPRRRVLTYLEQCLFSDQGSRFVMTNSKLLGKHVMEYYDVPREKISVIYNSVDLSRFSFSVRETRRQVMRKKYDIRDPIDGTGQ